MYSLLKKLGLSETIASVLMVIFGILIILKPALLAYLVAIYLILVGLLKILVPKE